MTLLREIQAAAVDSTVHLPDLLRKCKILAARLGSPEFKAWVDHELNGYPGADTVPPYRVLRLQSYGSFVGAFGRRASNMPIPPSCIPKEHRHLVTAHQVVGPISELTELLRADGTDGFRVNWHGDLIAAFATNIYEDMNCISAWKEVSRGSIAAIVDTVRTRVLNFVLEIEMAAPDAGEAPLNSQPVPPPQVLQIFNTQVAAEVGNLAIGGQGVQQAAEMTVKKGDVGSLREALRNLRLSKEDIAGLEAAIKEDAVAVETKPKMGPKVNGWLGSMIGKAANGTLKIASDVAGSVLTKVVTKFLGLPD
jgi:hypothetical protein